MIEVSGEVVVLFFCDENRRKISTGKWEGKSSSLGREVQPPGGLKGMKKLNLVAKARLKKKSPSPR